MRPIDYFDIAVERHGAETAIVDGETRLSFSDLRALSDRIAAAVTACSPAPPPFPVAIYSPNDYRVLALMIGAMRAGAALLPMHDRNSPDVNHDVLSRVGPVCLFYHSSVAREAQALKARSPSVVRWICLDRAGDGDPSLAEFIGAAAAPAADWADVHGNPDWPVFYWQTSGTTDRPKIVIDDCGTFDATLRVMRQRRQEVPTRPIVLAVAPLSHAGGCHAFSRLTLGGTVVIMRTFDARELLRLVAEHRVTDMWLPPTVLALVLDCADVMAFDLSSLARVDLGAAAVAPATLRAAVRLLGPCVSQTYGQIECGVVTVLDPATIAAAVDGDRPARLLSSGRTVMTCRWAIMSEDGTLLPCGETGEIVVRGRSVKRYLDPAQTAEARRHGWHHTGDLGCVDDDGFLYISGRQRDVIIVGGFKVLAAEVEQALLELSEMSECAVVAAPDLVRGEAIKAVVVFKPGQSLSDEELLAHCRRRLPRGKSPTSFDRWPILPKSAVGKIDKRSIRSQVWAAAGSHAT
jgi:fatty-acyl-CoA synthase